MICQECNTLIEKDVFNIVVRIINSFNHNLNVAWDKSYQLRHGGMSGHHKKPITKKICNQNSVIAKTKKENIQAEAVEMHYQKCLKITNHRPVYADAVETIAQREIMHEMGLPPTWHQFKKQSLS